ncbi:chromatin assembly factor 1 subunit A [Callorhinchus milii]|uniref:chromatin assembly factor 1 subunit A n=1 Tax=Callorhinchus milii TaxID=7868 RepID=UPI001C3F9001|nr:chromatin assembly factor 1 subunit A [Callorhinchus milii]XP_007899319.2 chromatin assembly factor 1 subunit A [Callorhinchus milii]XP_042198701.1 chromatin assembly factor 1 subunit A [Callorhinchus milii]
MEECKLKTVASAKKLVQARLPFKRLNPVPKPQNETTDAKRAKLSPTSPAQLTAVKLVASVDDVENDCEVDVEDESRKSSPEGSLVSSKLVMGKGPLDNYVCSVQKSKSAVKMDNNECKITIDLTEESSNGVSDSAVDLDLKTTSAKGLNTKKKIYLENKCNWLVSVKTDVTEGASSSEFVNHQSSSIEMTSRHAKAKPEQDHEDILKGRVPVVVLKDIMADKSYWSGSPEKCIEKEQTSFTESESSDSPVSSLSSSISASESSPEVKSPEVTSPEDEKCSDSPTSTTPRRKISEGPRMKGERFQKQQERDEKKQKLQMEKQEKGRARDEARIAKERAKEEAKKKRDEEKEQKDKERREKKEKEEKEKAERLRIKEEKRKEKQDAMEAKLEEKRKKEEEKRLKEEEKRMKAEKVKESSEISRFFQKPKAPQAPKTLAGSCGKFAPFEIKEHMVLAPTSRICLDPKSLEQFDERLEDQSFTSNYLKELHGYKPRTSGPTCPRLSVAESIACSDVIVVETSTSDGNVDRKKFGRMKLLQFHENHRPAYWGTWQKNSVKVNPRHPLAKDEVLLDYEVDSDDEWEEEEPGESLSHSEGDDDDEGDDEDDDDGFFVPHGYLSEGERSTDEEGENPEKQKIRQRLKAKEWDELMKGKKFQVLQPLLIGCVWVNDSDEVDNPALKILQQFSVCVLKSRIEDEQQQEMHNRKARDHQILIQLLPLLHGNVNGRKAIINEFQEWYRQKLSDTLTVSASNTSPINSEASRPQTPTVDGDLTVPSKAKLKRLISENGVYEKRTVFKSRCWYVHEEVLKRFGRENLPVPTQWNYLTPLHSVIKEDGAAAVGGAQTNPNSGKITSQCLTGSAKRKAAGSMSIKKFMHKYVDAEAYQVAVMETDGFQADTEEDDDTDCVIVEVHTNQSVPNKNEKEKLPGGLCQVSARGPQTLVESCSASITGEQKPADLCLESDGGEQRCAELCSESADGEQSSPSGEHFPVESSTESARSEQQPLESSIVEMMDVFPCENSAVGPSSSP